MFCKNCGKEIKKESSYCSDCGNKIKQEKIGVEINDEGNAKSKSFGHSVSEILSRIVGIIIFLLAIGLGKTMGFSFTIFVVILVVPYYIGQWFPKWYFKREKINYSLVNWIAWSNVLTWLLPPLGILTGVATFEFSSLVRQEGKKYKLLAIISIALSVVNAVVGIIIKL